MQRAAAARQRARGHIVTGRQNGGAELARGGQQVVELDRLVALRRTAPASRRPDSSPRNDRSPAALKRLLVVEHVMRNADALRHRARIVDILLLGAAGTLAVRGGAMVVELQRLRRRRRSPRPSSAAPPPYDGRIHAARHRHDDARVLRPGMDVEAVRHGPVISAPPGAVASEAGAVGSHPVVDNPPLAIRDRQPGPNWDRTRFVVSGNRALLYRDATKLAQCGSWSHRRNRAGCPRLRFYQKRQHPPPRHLLAAGCRRCRGRTRQGLFAHSSLSLS